MDAENDYGPSLIQQHTFTAGSNEHQPVLANAGVASTEPRVPVFVATLMKKQGETGVHTHFNTLASHFEDFGTPFEVLTPYEAPALLRRLIGIAMRLIKPFSVEYSWYIRVTFYAQLLSLRMRARIPSESPWIIYAQDPVSARVAERFRKSRGQNIVLVIHFNKSQAEEVVESRHIRRGGRVYRKVQAGERTALLTADRLVFVSDFMRKHLCRSLEGLSSRPLTILPNFVSAPFAANDGYHGDLATIGTLEPRKNQGFLLAVLAAAKRRGFRYTLTIFGTGMMEQPWRRLAAELGVSELVTFAGYVPQASAWLHRHRVYVHASRIENMPISLIEAQASGLPVIAARVGGIPEIVSEGVTGYFWDLDDPKSAAELLILLLEDPAQLASMRTAALESYSSRFDADTIAPRLRRFIISGDLELTKGTLDGEHYAPSSLDDAPIWTPAVTQAAVHSDSECRGHGLGFHS